MSDVGTGSRVLEVFCSYWIWSTMTLEILLLFYAIFSEFLLWKKFEVRETLRRIHICVKKMNTTILARGGNETSMRTYQNFSQLVCELCRKWRLLVCPEMGSIARSVRPRICCQMWALGVVWSAEEEPKLVNSQRLLAFPNQQQGVPPRSSLPISAILAYGMGFIWTSRAAGDYSCTSCD